MSSRSSHTSVLQIAAIQAGLVKVVPQAVLDLLTWKELEKKVCGDPEISVEALKRLSKRVAPSLCASRIPVCPVAVTVSPSPTARYEDMKQTDVRVQYLWQALTNFTNGE